MSVFVINGNNENDKIPPKPDISTIANILFMISVLLFFSIISLFIEKNKREFDALNANAEVTKQIRDAVDKVFELSAQAYKLCL